MDWRAAGSVFLGAVPNLLVGVAILYFTYRTSRRMEVFKKELDQQSQKRSAWHDKRVLALLDLYDAFREHLDFLRKKLYLERGEGSMDPYWAFRLAVDKNLVFLDDNLALRIKQLSGELLLFWNWAMEQRQHGQEGLSKVRNKLDYEIPDYLEKLRKLINASAVGDAPAPDKTPDYLLEYAAASASKEPGPV